MHTELKHEQFTNVLSVCSNTPRLQILIFLRNEERSVGEISKKTGYSKYNASQQLCFLKEEYFINFRKSGRNSYYKVSNQNIISLLDDFPQSIEGFIISSHNENLETKKAA